MPLLQMWMFLDQLKPSAVEVHAREGSGKGFLEGLHTQLSSNTGVAFGFHAYCTTWGADSADLSCRLDIGLIRFALVSSGNWTEFSLKQNMGISLYTWGVALRNQNPLPKSAHNSWQSDWGAKTGSINFPFSWLNISLPQKRPGGITQRQYDHEYLSILGKTGFCS